MNDATLQHYRNLADAMQGPEPRDWQWNGQWMSQQRYGLTERNAKELAARHGGTARQM